MAHASPSIEGLGRNARLLIAPFDLIFLSSLNEPPAALPSPPASAKHPKASHARADQGSCSPPSAPRRTASRLSPSYGPAPSPAVEPPGSAPTRRSRSGRSRSQPSNKSPSGSPQLAKPQKDIRVAEFRAALQEQGFVFLKQAVRFVDRRGSAYRTLLPVTDERGRMLRRETLAALHAWRAEHEASLTAKAALQQQRIALAERLAPKAMPGCRADLTEAAAIAQLADDFLTRVAGFGHVEFKALIQMGWSAQQLREHGDAARVLADRRAVPA